MYEQVFELQANLLKALAHPRRLEIVNLLRDQILCVSDIYEMLDLPQANISQHLMILRDAGILITSRDGKQIKYQIADAKVLAAADLLREFLIDQQSNSPLASQLSLSMKELLPIVHDPVCGMRVSPKTAGDSARFQNQAYFFCASGCLKKFQKQPEKYAQQ